MSRADARFQAEIVPIGDVAPEVLAWLRDELETQYPWIGCETGRTFAPRAEWGADAGRFWADHVLDSVVEWHFARHGDVPDRWLLAVTDADLAAPDRPFAFGEATLGGCCAVIGLARFRDSDPDPATARALLRLRMLKEACHELGHVLGLDHCDRTGCVMFPASGVEAVDHKSSELCARCSAAAERALHDRP